MLSESEYRHQLTLLIQEQTTPGLGQGQGQGHVLLPGRPGSVRQNFRARGLPSQDLASQRSRESAILSNLLHRSHSALGLGAKGQGQPVPKEIGITSESLHLVSIDLVSVYSCMYTNSGGPCV